MSEVVSTRTDSTDAHVAGREPETEEKSKKQATDDDSYANGNLGSTEANARAQENIPRPTSDDNSQVTGGRWSPEEDAKLRSVVKEHGPKNWKVISKIAFNGSRTDVQCLHRWQKVLRPGLVKGPWTKEENEIIINLINTYGLGNIKWSEIAAALPGRLGKQCRERWVNHLDPNLKKTAWTEEEDRILMEQQKALGNKWRDIAVFLPGRSENSVKNRWNSARRKRKRSEAAAAANAESRSLSSSGRPLGEPSGSKAKLDRKPSKKGGTVDGRGGKANFRANGQLQGPAKKAKANHGRGGKRSTPRLTKAQIEERRQQEMREQMEEHQNAMQTQQQHYANAMMMGHGMSQYGSYPTNSNAANLYNQMNVLPTMPGPFGGTTSPHNFLQADYHNPHMQQAMLLGMAGIGQSGAGGSLSPTFMTGGMIPMNMNGNMGVQMNDPLAIMYHNQHQQMQFRNQLHTSNVPSSRKSSTSSSFQHVAGSSQNSSDGSSTAPPFPETNPRSDKNANTPGAKNVKSNTSVTSKTNSTSTTPSKNPSSTYSPSKKDSKETDLVKPFPRIGSFGSGQNGLQVVGNSLSEKQKNLLRESPTKFDDQSEKGRTGSKQYQEGLEVIGLKSLDNNMLQEQEPFELFTFDDLVGDMSDFYNNGGGNGVPNSHSHNGQTTTTSSSSSTPVPRSSVLTSKQFDPARSTSTSPLATSFEGIGGIVHVPGSNGDHVTVHGNDYRTQGSVVGGSLHNRSLSPATVNALLGNMAPSS